MTYKDYLRNASEDELADFLLSILVSLCEAFQISADEIDWDVEREELKAFLNSSPENYSDNLS